MVATARTGRHHQKRQGKHQKRNQHFLRVYAPYIPVLLLFFANLTFSFRSFAVMQSKQSSNVLAYATNMSPQLLVDSTNSQRSAYSAGALSLNSKLNSAAQAKANDMATRNYWSHNTPEGNPPWYFITNSGYSYSRAGENLAYGFTEVNGALGVIAGWMNSPSHKENLINPAYTEVGFGIANAAMYQGHSEETIVVAMYATPYGVAKNVQPQPAPVSPTPQTIKQVTQPAPKAEVTPAEREVVVTILDENGKPAPFVKVTLHSFPQVGYTDENGTVTFKNVEIGEHTATAETAYGTTEKKVVVSDTQNKVAVTISKPLPQNQTTSSIADESSSAKTMGTKKSNSINLITRGSAPWITAVLFIISLIGMAYVLLKHSIKIHKLLIRGEKYIFHHALLDLTIVNFVVLCYFLSRSIGFIL